MKKKIYTIIKKRVVKQGPAQHYSYSAGFTLMEALTGAILGGIVLMIIYSSFVTGQKLTQRGALNAELSQNGRISLDRISREIRQTDQVTTTLSEDPPDPSQAEIIFEDGHTDIIQYIRYYLSGTDLRKEIKHYYFPSDPGTWVDYNAKDGYGQPANSNIDSDQIVAQFVSHLNFYGEKTIGIDLSIEKDGRKIDFRTKNLGRNL